MNPITSASPLDDTPETTPPEAGFAASKSQALQAAEELRAAAGTKAQQLKQAAEHRARQLRDAAEDRAGKLKDAAGRGAEQIKDAAGPAIEDAFERAKEVREEVEAYVRANPTKSVLSALGIGFVLGLLLRR
ncbi:MAG: ElaB/YqjD/DUF883 family membrane-anchored ribosome-binding protein [Verrucomicrobiales bacterium]|jgi:ElaB/YqjD/DUF883 family membrane-anchored ribosome-binding protein